MTDARWKAVERAFGEILGLVRAGPLGREGPDLILADEERQAGSKTFLAPEIKSREDIPQWLTDALDQAEANAGPGQLPFVILHRVGDKYMKAAVIFRLRTILEY